MRIALWIVGVLAALILIGLALLHSFFDGEKIKPRLQQEVQSRYQRELSFDGPLGLSVLPRLGLSLPATTLSQHGSHEPFARIDSARVSVALWPLLRGKLEIDTITIDGLKATLVRSRDGKTNIDDLLGATTATTAPTPKDSTPPVAPTDFELGGLKLSRADLSLNDLKDGKLVHLSQIELRTGRIAPRTETAVDLSASYSLNQPALLGQIKASGKIQLDLPAANYGVEQLLATSSGTLDGAAFEIKLDAPQLKLGADTASAKTITLSAKLAGASALDARLVIDGLTGSTAAIVARQLELAVTQKQGQRSTAIQIAGPAKASLASRVIDLPTMKGELTLIDPSLPDGKLTAPLTGNLNLDGAREVARLALTTTLDGGAVALKADLTGFAKPAINFDLDAAKLDLDHWFPPAPTPATKAAQAQFSLISSAHAAEVADTIDLGFLKDLKLKGEVRVAALRARGIQANQVRTTLNAANGRLSAAPISAQLYGGTLAGSASVQLKHQFNTQVQLNGVALAPLLRDAGLKDKLEGRATIRTELAAAGATPAALLQSLAGTFTARIDQGALRGINLERILAQARSRQLSQLGRQTERSNEADKTEFSELSASFVIAQGIARNNDLKAISPVLRVTGTGAIDLPAASINYSLRAALASNAQRAASLTIPVNLNGPLADIQYTIDWATVASDSIKSELERRLAPGKTGENPLDKLKQLFKR